jgi:hypothetical protein
MEPTAMQLKNEHLELLGSLVSPFGPREAQPKRRKIVPRAERFFAPVEFTLVAAFIHPIR